MRIYLFILLVTIWSFGCSSVDESKLSIATAANMQFAATELAAAFTQKTAIDCELIISSSGKLTAQIKEGAPFDLFLSANMKYPDQLFEDGLTIGPPEVYAFGNLVLWTMYSDLEPGIQVLESDRIQHIAMANPRNAPYGAAAESVLQNYELLAPLTPKLVYGESIAQTNQFIVSKAAEIGFTAQSVVLSPRMKTRGKWKIIPTDLYPPIKQGVVVLKSSPEKEKMAKQFISFLSSEEGKIILKEFGYATVN